MQSLDFVSVLIHIPSAKTHSGCEMCSSPLSSHPSVAFALSSWLSKCQPATRSRMELCRTWWPDYKDVLRKLWSGSIRHLVLDTQQGLCQLWLIWFLERMHFQFLRTCKGILSRKPQPQVLNRRCMSIQIAFLQVVRLFSRLAVCDTTSS